MLLNEIEVVNYAQVIKSCVAFFDMFQVITGKFFTFITEFDLVVQNLFASFLDKSALFVSGSQPLQ
jgi:hypothetical protein